MNAGAGKTNEGHALRPIVQMQSLVASNDGDETSDGGGFGKGQPEHKFPNSNQKLDILSHFIPKCVLAHPNDYFFNIIQIRIIP